MTNGWLAKFRAPKRKRTKRKSKRIEKRKIIHVVMMPPDINAPPVPLSTTKLGSQSVNGKILQSPANVISLDVPDPSDTRFWGADGKPKASSAPASRARRRVKLPSSLPPLSSSPSALTRVAGLVSSSPAPLSVSPQVRLSPAAAPSAILGLVPGAEVARGRPVTRSQRGLTAQLNALDAALAMSPGGRKISSLEAAGIIGSG